MLGVSALHGRLLLPEDDGRDREELWRERFGADPGLVRRVIRLDGKPHTVVGTVPRRFGVPHGAQIARGEE